MIPIPLHKYRKFQICDTKLAKFFAIGDDIGFQTEFHARSVAKQNMKYSRIFFLALAAIAALTFFAPARAGGPIPLTVTNCNDDVELRDAISELQNGEGGTLNFNCGTKTITLTSQLPEITHDTQIDGGNKITLSGNNSVRLLWVKKTGKLTLKNIIVEKGYGGLGVGGAIINDGLLTLEHATLQYNYTPKEGGAIAAYNTVVIRNSTFFHNIAGYGGAIYADAGAASFEVNISNSNFLSNTADSNKWGGAINAFAKLVIDHTHFENNAAGSGGAIYSNYGLAFSMLTDNTFHKNITTGADPNANGGAIWLDGAQMNIERTSFTENNAHAGGAIHVMPLGQLILGANRFDKNNSLYGGALFNKGQVLVSQNTFYLNQGFAGGAVNNQGAMQFFNSTFSENNASYGGGFLQEAGVTQMVHVTLARNNATVNGEALWNFGAGNPELRLFNVIVADSVHNQNCYFGTPLKSVKNSLSSDASCNFGGQADNVDVRLAPLADNGGFTRTHLLQTGSPAIDGAAFTDLSMDQRGFTRPQGAALDVGAVEVQPGEICASKPAQPVLVKPGNNKKVKGPQVTLDWNDAKCATRYNVIMKIGSPQGARVFKQNNLTLSQTTTGALAQGKTFYWRVIATNEFGKAKSSWRAFTTK